MFTRADYGLILAVGLILSGCAPSADTVPSHLLDLDGNPFDLWRDRDAPATVVLFVRRDCPISNRYAPTIRGLHERFHPRGVEFLLTYVDPHETPDAIRAHLAEFDYPCAALRDPGHVLVRQTGATVTPEAVVFDRNAEVRYRGRIDDLYVSFGHDRPAATTHDLADALDAVLSGQPVAVPVTEAIGCYIGDLQK